MFWYLCYWLLFRKNNSGIIFTLRKCLSNIWHQIWLEIWWLRHQIFRIYNSKSKITEANQKLTKNLIRFSDNIMIKYWFSIIFILFSELQICTKNCRSTLVFSSPLRHPSECSICYRLDWFRVFPPPYQICTYVSHNRLDLILLALNYFSPVTEGHTFASDLMSVSLCYVIISSRFLFCSSNPSVIFSGRIFLVFFRLLFRILIDPFHDLVPY